MSPNSYRLTISQQRGVSCRAVTIPNPWTFDAAMDTTEQIAAAKVSYEFRREPQVRDTLLLAGLSVHGESRTYSHETYRIRFHEPAPLEPVRPSDWLAASVIPLTRTPVASAHGHDEIEPRIGFNGKTFELSGAIFWNAPEVTRLSENGRLLLGISYRNEQGFLRPHHSVYFDVFSTTTGNRVWMARGEGPVLPPFSQFEVVSWLGDEILLMPHNLVGTNFEVCLFEMNGR